MASEVNFTASQRNVLNELKSISSAASEASNRIATGKKVNSVIDDAYAFFQSEGLYNRADLFSERKQDIDQAITAISTTLSAIENIDDLLNTMRGIAESARTQSGAELAATRDQFNEVGNQISQLIEDSYYNGYNLLNSTANVLDVLFSDRTASLLSIQGVGLNATVSNDDTLFTVAAFNANNDFLGVTALGNDIDAVVASIDTALTRLQTLASSFSTSSSILQSRSDFTQDYVESLQAGGDNLTLADLTEEAAKLTALQTRQILSIEALSITNSFDKEALRLMSEN